MIEFYIDHKIKKNKKEKIKGKNRYTIKVNL